MKKNNKTEKNIDIENTKIMYREKILNMMKEHQRDLIELLYSRCDDYYKDIVSSLVLEGLSCEEISYMLYNIQKYLNSSYTENYETEHKLKQGIARNQLDFILLNADIKDNKKQELYRKLINNIILTPTHKEIEVKSKKKIFINDFVNDINKYTAK